MMTQSPASKPKRKALRDVPTGVYLGWASVGQGGVRCKAVVNVGYSPTFVGEVCGV